MSDKKKNKQTEKYPEQPSFNSTAPASCVPVGSAAHAVVSRSVGPPDDDGDLGDVGARHCRHHFGSIFGNSSSFVLSTHHEAYSADTGGRRAHETKVGNGRQRTVYFPLTWVNMGEEDVN